MKKLIIAGLVTALFACNNTDQFDANLDKKVSQPSNATNSMVQPSQNSATTPAPILNTNQPSVNNTPVVTSAVTTPAQTTTTPAGMNPPHGQPGHRCELAVGAPLNSATPAKTKTSTVPQQNITVTPTTNTTTAATAPGMNPPHGQPGHRCDITVGAPLNSAPAKKEEEKKPEYQVLKPQPDSSRN
jgi:hypothetical protein